MKKRKDTPITILLKGMLMGVADIIPGISGGTIAMITGIYERLVRAIKETGTFLQKLPGAIIRKQSLKKRLKLIDYNLFAPLITGIAIAFLLGAWLLPGLIEKHTHYVYSFFTGLILSSAIFILREIKQKKAKGYLFGAAGLVLGLIISSSTNTLIETEPSIIYTFFLGMIALMAMILPGVSGAFILFLFGQYEFMLSALRNIHVGWPYVISFAAGGIIGLLGFSRILSFLLKKYRAQTLFFLSGLMLGALYAPVTIIIYAKDPGTIALSAAFLVLGFIIVFLLKSLSGTAKKK